MSKNVHGIYLFPFSTYYSASLNERSVMSKGTRTSLHSWLRDSAF